MSRSQSFRGDQSQGLRNDPEMGREDDTEKRATSILNWTFASFAYTFLGPDVNARRHAKCCDVCERIVLSRLGW